MSDLYINAFDRRSGRVVDVPLSRLEGGCCEQQYDECNNASLVGSFTSPIKLTPTAQMLTLSNYSMYPPNTFGVKGGDITFNVLGVYNVDVSGSLSSTPRTNTTTTVSASPSGNTVVIGPKSFTASTGTNGSASFDYPLLVSAPSCGSNLKFTASSSNANVSLLNSSINIIKISQ